MSSPTLKVYRSNDIAVSFDASRCIHTAKCLRGLPAVFDKNARPWIRLDAASADAVAETVSNCPSGALQFERLDNGPEEKAPTVPVIRIMTNGPLSVHGKVDLVTKEGENLQPGLRMTLCRCGQSANKPYCDNSHKRVEFKAD